MKPTLVVLAAGMGSRYGGVKQMDGFGPNDQWLLEYSVFDAIRAGFGKVVFILRQAIVEDFSNYFEERLPSHIEREYVLQELTDLPNSFVPPADREKPWGTGHAMLVAKDVIKEPFAVINADDYYGPDAYKQVCEFLTSVDNDSYQFGMVGYLLKNTLSKHGTVSRGVCEISDEGNLVQIEEMTKIKRDDDSIIRNTGDGTNKDLVDNTIVSMNFWAFTSAMFPKLEEYFSEFLTQRGTELKSEYYIPLAVQDFMNNDQSTVNVMTSEDEWFGVTYAEDKDNVEAQLKEKHDTGVYPDHLWK